jgi:hypothetical protein
MGVQTRVEGARGCGYRKPGGLYLVSGQLSEPCPLLPYETHVCPTCGEGIRPARGYTWVDGAKFIPPVEHGTLEHNAVCPLSPKLPRELTDEELALPPHKLGEPEVLSRIGRCGLIWIGEQHYKTPREFMAEAARMGVSRRITQVPRDFVIGETWILLGHRKAITKACSECGDEAHADAECPVCNGEGFEHRPGVITAFRPTAIEYVVKGDETDEEIEALEKRGLTPVKVVNDEPQATLEWS